MSCQRIVRIFETQRVVIDTCNKKELETLEKSIVNSINQKLEKLNILIKNCDVYSNGNCILVNDRFGICFGLKDVAEAFGLKCQQVECSLRGKTYLISDDLLGFLAQIDVKHQYGANIANRDIAPDILEIMGKFGATEVDPKVLDMVRNIREHGGYTIDKTRMVEETYYNQKLEKTSAGQWNIDEEPIRQRLLRLSQDAGNLVNKTNENLRDGTSKLIYTRARQMGYAVQEVKKGNQVQLVLVRSE